MDAVQKMMRVDIPALLKRLDKLERGLLKIVAEVRAKK